MFVNKLRKRGIQERRKGGRKEETNEGQRKVKKEKENLKPEC